MESGVQHYAGTVLTGRRPDPETADHVAADDALAVLCRLSYLAEMPDHALEPLATRTRLVVSARGDEPLLPTAHLAIGARVGSGEAARTLLRSIARAPRNEAVEIFELRGALPEGVTASVHAETLETFFREGIGEVRRQISVLVSREAGGALTAALVIESLAPDSPIGGDHDDDQSVLERQIVLLEDSPRIGGGPLVLVIPSPFDPFLRNTFVAELSVGRPRNDAPHRQAVAQCIEDLRRHGTAARAGIASVDETELRSRTLASSIQALDLAEHHRSAIVFIAATNDAPLALDLALSGDATTLAAWITSFVAETGGAPIAGKMVDEELAWNLDRTAWQLLAERLHDDELPTGLRGTLVLHAGEAGRFPGAIGEALEASSDRATFDAAILADNLSFLSSPDPAARVRAFDWLGSRGEAPEGYDPLAPREERREALALDERKRSIGGRR